MRLALTLVAAAVVAASGTGIASAQSQDGRYDDQGPRGDRDRGPRDDRYGRGGSQATIYVDDKFHGRSVVIDRPIRSLREVDMNDKVSSIDLRGGSWLVCSDDDFRGRCVTLDRSIRKLDSIGMDDKISSMRPIGGR